MQTNSIHMQALSFQQDASEQKSQQDLALTQTEEVHIEHTHDEQICKTTKNTSANRITTTNSAASDTPIYQDKPFYRLMLVTQRATQPLNTYLRFIEQCAQAGITSVQLREKNNTHQELVAFGKSLQTILKPYRIPLIINDNLRVALELNAEGIHLGQTDGDPWEARQMLGPDKIIGLSIDSEANLHHANSMPLNYVGIGSIFMTHNKTNVTTYWGLAGLSALKGQSKHPIVAIGGIDATNAADVYAAGADGIAAIGAFHNNHDLKKTIQHMY